MSLNGTQIITTVGQTLLASAMGSGLAVEITEVALGDGLGARYDPQEDQSGLKREKARAAIKSRYMSDANTWRLVVEFGDEIPSFKVREVGFFDANGALIFLVAGATIREATTGAFDLIYDAYLNLSNIKDGLVTVNAPDDAVFGLALATATALANIQLQQLRQADAIRALANTA